jgi:hypothetical protein
MLVARKASHQIHTPALNSPRSLVVTRRCPLPQRPNKSNLTSNSGKRVSNIIVKREGTVICSRNVETGLRLTNPCIALSECFGREQPRHFCVLPYRPVLDPKDLCLHEECANHRPVFY